MLNIEVREFKIKIGKKEYTFRLDFEALRKFEKKYGTEGMMLFNGFLGGKNVYDCIVKILGCACIEKEWDEEELARSIPFNFNMMKLLDEITFALVEGMLGDKNEGTGQSQAEKN